MTQFWWHLARASGLVAWLLLVLALVWGVLLATRVLKPRDRPAWLLDLHRMLGGLAAVMVGVHVAALFADSYVEFRLVDFLVPFASPYKPLAVAIGVFSAYLLVAVQVSSLVLRHISKVWWRRIHMVSYLLVLLVSWHAVLAGTDVTKSVYVAATTLLVLTPLGAIAIRILRPRRELPPRASAPRHARRTKQLTP